MQAARELCVLCAWEENCSRKFSISGCDICCADFARDLKIKEDEMSEGEAGGEKEDSMPGFVMPEKKKYNSQHEIDRIRLDVKKPGFLDNTGEESLQGDKKRRVTGK